MQNLRIDVLTGDELPIAGWEIGQQTLRKRASKKADAQHRQSVGLSDLRILDFIDEQQIGSDRRERSHWSRPPAEPELLPRWTRAGPRWLIGLI